MDRRGHKRSVLAVADLGDEPIDQAHSRAAWFSRNHTEDQQRPVLLFLLQEMACSRWNYGNSFATTSGYPSHREMLF